MNYTRMSDTSLPPGADYANFYQQSAQEDRYSHASAPAGRSQMDDSIGPTEIEESLVPIAYELLQKLCEEFKRVYDDLEAMPSLEHGPQADDFAVNHREPPLKTRLETINILPIEELRRKFDSEVQQNAILQRDLRAIRNTENFLKQRLSFAETLLYRQKDVIDKVRNMLEKDLREFNDREQIRIQDCKRLKQERKECIVKIKEYMKNESRFEKTIKDQKKSIADLEKKYATTSEKAREIQNERNALRDEVDQLKRDVTEQRTRVTDLNKLLTTEQKALADEKRESCRLNTELQRHAAKIDQLDKQIEKERENFAEQMERTERALTKQKTEDVDALKRRHREDMSGLKSEHEKQLHEFRLASERALQDANDENEALRIERDKFADELNKVSQNRESWERQRIAELQQHYLRKNLEANVEFGRERALESARHSQKIYPRQSYNPARGYLKDLNCPSAIHSDTDSPTKDQNLPPPLRSNPPIRRTSSVHNVPTSSTAANISNRRLQQVIHKVVAPPKDTYRSSTRRN